MTDERIAEIERLIERKVPIARSAARELIAALRETRVALAGRTVSCERCNEAAEDTRRLDWLGEQQKNTGGWVCRDSTIGRGIRLHETSGSEARRCGWEMHFTPRAAIDAAMAQEGK